MGEPQRLIRRFSTFLLAIALAALVTAGPVTPVLAVGGQTYVQLTNVKRASVGKAAVGFSTALDKISVERAHQLATTDVFEHDMAYIGRRLSQLGVCYSSVGEIIAWERGYPTYDYQRTIDQWWASSGHHAIMVGDYNGAGGSHETSSGTNKLYSVMVFAKLCQAPTASTGKVSRIAGSDRYATAAAISRSRFSAGVRIAYIATGFAFSDALSGSAAAADDDGPVLLVARDSIPSATAKELARLRPGRIVVLGGSGVVSSGVFRALDAYTAGSVTRIAGKDRYATSALVSRSSFASGAPVAYVATGEAFPDALGGSAAAGHQGGPVLLVRQGFVPDVTATELRRLAPRRIVVLGGTSAVSDAVLRSLDAYTSGTVTRLAGADRYATAVKISRSGFGDAAAVYVATGVTFPDGLAGGPVAGLLPAPLLLVPSRSLPLSVVSELQRLTPSHVYVLGGSSVISDSVMRQIEAVLP